MYEAFLDIGENLSILGVASFPPFGASIAVMIIQTVCFLAATMIIDERTIATLQPAHTDRVVDESLLDEDVIEERHKITESLIDHTNDPLRIDRLRKVYPPVRSGGESVIAVEDVTLSLKTGEVFGLLGANGAGKTTLLSMLTRLCAPTSGNAFIAQNSILDNFRKVATNLGVVTQNNALWDRLSVENHLYLFARLRGVPEKEVKTVVEDVLEQLELAKHRKKLSMRLSGGMKRKLCVAIALIGDPKVVLLDEPSAGKQL
jgi:ABC-type lipoprotein export system ATPase subunit